MVEHSMVTMSHHNLGYLKISLIRIGMKQKTSSMPKSRETTPWAWNSNPKSSSLLIKSHYLKLQEQGIRTDLKKMPPANLNSDLRDQVMVKVATIQLNRTFIWASR